MSVIQTNARGVDVVELEFYTKGSHQAQVTTRDNVVAADKDYVFGVSELIIPSASLPSTKLGLTNRETSLSFLSITNSIVSDVEILINVETSKML